MYSVDINMYIQQEEHTIYMYIQTSCHDIIYLILNDTIVSLCCGDAYYPMCETRISITLLCTLSSTQTCHYCSLVPRPSFIHKHNYSTTFEPCFPTGFKGHKIITRAEEGEPGDEDIKSDYCHFVDYSHKHQTSAIQ